jgi:hypothetical protein
MDLKVGQDCEVPLSSLSTKLPEKPATRALWPLGNAARVCLPVEHLLEPLSVCEMLSLA